MIVVADTSPLNYLVLLGHIDVLANIYGEVLVPQTVLDELQDSDAPAEVRAWAAAPPRWLQISTLKFRLDPLLERLDRGEQDAILLAESFKAERLIIDDLEGRREAANRGLPVIGTLASLRKQLVATSWTCRRHSPLYKQPTFMLPRTLSSCCSRTMPRDGSHRRQRPSKDIADRDHHPGGARHPREAASYSAGVYRRGGRPVPSVPFPISLVSLLPHAPARGPARVQTTRRRATI
jgi:predicted nucleic acid-binding protein